MEQQALPSNISDRDPPVFRFCPLPALHRHRRKCGPQEGRARRTGQPVPVPDKPSNIHSASRLAAHRSPPVSAGPHPPGTIFDPPPSSK
jgi:hypothetical protein